MAKTNVQEQVDLAARVAQLEAILRNVGIQTASRPVDPKDRADYIEWGTEKHAAFLGLKHAAEGDLLVEDGWTLADMTAFGPAARPEFLREILRQKVNEWRSGPPPISPDAPALWKPAPVDQYTGIG